MPWRDPQTGYVRRNISPPNFPSPIQIVDVVLPAGAIVAYETGARDENIHQQIWVQEGSIDCVKGGASVIFMLPMSRFKAENYWTSMAAASVARGERMVGGCLLLLKMQWGRSSARTVQVILEQPENQPHRGDVAKMLVHRRARRQGIGAALLAAAKQSAFRAVKTLLVLDTASADAERLYARQGWQRCGEIPNYALWSSGGLYPTTFFYKLLND